jgi:hypothetical protein
VRGAVKVAVGFRIGSDGALRLLPLLVASGREAVRKNAFLGRPAEPAFTGAPGSAWSRATMACHERIAQPAMVWSSRQLDPSSRCLGPLRRGRTVRRGDRGIVTAKIAGR